MKVLDVKGRVLMIEMTQQEALRTIQSLTNQILYNNPNAGRYEQKLDKDTRDFTIAVRSR